MSARAPLPLGHHPNWLPFIAAVELALRQVGDPDQAMKDVISALNSKPVGILLVVRGVRRLMDPATDKLRVNTPEEWDDDDRRKLTKEWRDETTIELHGEPVLVFVWRPDLEEFLGLRPAAPREEKPPHEEKPKPAVETPPETAAPRGEQPSPAHAGAKEPFLRWRMIIAILCRAFPNGFTADDIAGKTGIVRDGWKAECKTPLGNARKPVSYGPPDRKTVRTAIRDYLTRPGAYLTPR